jgi:hypothetical protein
MGFRIDTRLALGNLHFLFLAVVLGASCGGSGDDTTISKQPLAGTINGQPWSIGTATASAQWNPYSAFGSEYFLSMYPVSFTACTDGTTPASADPLHTLVQKTVGIYTIRAPESPTWQPYPSGSGGTTGGSMYVDVSFASGLTATKGRVVVSNITATTIAGGANITFDVNNSLDGQFQATICP